MIFESPDMVSDAAWPTLANMTKSVETPESMPASMLEVRMTKSDEDIDRAMPAEHVTLKMKMLTTRILSGVPVLMNANSFVDAGERTRARSTGRRSLFQVSINGNTTCGT